MTFCNINSMTITQMKHYDNFVQGFATLNFGNCKLMLCDMSLVPKLDEFKSKKYTKVIGMNSESKYELDDNICKLTINVSGCGGDAYAFYEIPLTETNKLYLEEISKLKDYEEKQETYEYNGELKITVKYE